MLRWVTAAALLLAAFSAFLAAGATADTGKGNFVIRCDASHRAADDPIVFPGQPGASHEHQFTGNRSTNANSTYDSMQAAATSCLLPGDKAGYWVPTFLDPQNQPVTPLFSFSYYRNTPVALTTQAFPPDFRLVAGGEQDPAAVFWKCFKDASGLQHVTAIPTCAGPGNWLVLHIDFPQCTDGRTDSPDHRSHAVRPVGKACPADHPVKVPQLGLNFRWCLDCGGPGYHFSDGSTVLPHADFWNSWIQSELERLVSTCLNAGKVCGQVTH